MITEIKKSGFVFSVDKEKTSEYYAKHTLCDCNGCQNFYKQIKGLFPELEEFISQFGVDITKPDEMSWYDINKSIGYTPYYTVTGKIEKMGTNELAFENINVAFHQSDTPCNDIPNEQTESYFIIEIPTVDLPWILDTPFPSAPVKKGFIMRLLNKSNKK